MSKFAQYPEINSKFTLNKWKDGASDTRFNYELQELKNYIPGKGQIETREGITVLAFTPETTLWYPHEDPTYTIESSGPGGTEIALCGGVFRFEETATIGWNAINNDPVFTALYTTTWGGKSQVSNVILKEGNGSLWMIENGTSDKLYGLRSPWAHPFYFAGWTGKTTNVQLWTYWFYPTTASLASNAEWHMMAGNTSTAYLYAFATRHFDKNLQAWAISTASNVLRNYTHFDVVAEDQWQFVAFWYDGVHGQSGLYHYNDVTKVETITSSTTDLTTSSFRIHSTSITIGGKYVFTGAGGGHYSDDSDAFHGFFDYFTVWYSLFSENTSNLTLIRAIRNLHRSP